MAVGAYYNYGNVSNSGCVQVFSHSDKYLINIGGYIDGEYANDQLVYYVVIYSDGNIVAVGARYNDVNGNIPGYVLVFPRIGSSWVKVGYDIVVEYSNDRSGYSIAIFSGDNTVAVSVSSNNRKGGNYGHVIVYSNIEKFWINLVDDIYGEY